MTTKIRFLGTGSLLAPEGRYWSSFVIDNRILVEIGPAVTPNLVKAGISASAIEIAFISHLHADHFFGWPFLLLEYIVRSKRNSPLWIVGPPGVETALARLVDLSGLAPVVESARSSGVFPDVRIVEANEKTQTAGPITFRGIRVEHVPYLECYGFLIESDNGRKVGYSGDSVSCDGLRAIIREADIVIIDCNSLHPHPTHIHYGEIRSLREEFRDVPFILTHLGEEIESDDRDNLMIPQDYDLIEFK